MPRFVANLSMMYQEHAFLDRFAITAKDGFGGVEFLFPYNFGKADIRTRLDDAGLTQALFNASPGGWAGSERGIAPLPGREEEFKRDIVTALEYAQVFGNTRLHIMAGLLPAGIDCARHHTIYVSSVAYAAHEAAGASITTVLEPINTRNMPGFFLTHQAQAHAVCKEVSAANVKMQFDLYHAQIVEGDLSVKLKRYVDGVGHVQVADVPDRHEPDKGELHCPHLFALLGALSYNGWAGCKYRPRIGTSEGLGWLRRWRESQR